MGWFHDTFIGNRDRYNYTEMCIPQCPFPRCKKNQKSVNFYSKGRKL